MESLRIEATVKRITLINREVSGKAFNPLAVYLKPPSPESIIDNDPSFECSVHFETSPDMRLVSHKSLLRPNTIGNENIVSFFDTHFKSERFSFEEGHSLIQDVRLQISQVLQEGVPTISDTARQLGMSGRTLQRRLSKQGYSFQTLIDDTRRQLSERLLQETNHSLAEIALMTGYSEQSAFTRAFKRWAGQTPRSYRLNVQRSPQTFETGQAFSNGGQGITRQRRLMLIIIYA